MAALSRECLQQQLYGAFVYDAIHPRVYFVYGPGRIVVTVAAHCLASFHRCVNSHCCGITADLIMQSSASSRAVVMVTTFVLSQSY